MHHTLHKSFALENSSYCHSPDGLAVEYTDYISAEGSDPHPNECPRYDTEQSDGEAPVLDPGGMWSTLSLPLSNRYYHSVESKRVLNTVKLYGNKNLKLAEAQNLTLDSSILEMYPSLNQGGWVSLLIYLLDSMVGGEV